MTEDQDMEDSQKKRQALAQATKAKLGLNGRIIVGNLQVEHQPTKQTKAIDVPPQQFLSVAGLGFYTGLHFARLSTADATEFWQAVDCWLTPPAPKCTVSIGLRLILGHLGLTRKVLIVVEA